MKKAYPCPTCQTLSFWQNNPTRPFCSERCKLIDLGDWASERYKLANQSSLFDNDTLQINLDETKVTSDTDN